METLTPTPIEAAQKLYQQDVKKAIQEGFSSKFPFVQFTSMDYTHSALQVHVTAFDDLPKSVKRRYLRRASKS